MSSIKKSKVKNLTLISLLLLVGLNGFGQFIDEVWEELNEISFEMIYAKSGGRALNIEMEQYGNSAIVSINDNLSSVDTSFHISNEDYANCLMALLDIKSKDMNHGIRMAGADGNTFTVKYGNLQTNITYVVWAPTYDYKIRKLEGFLKAMKVILSTSKVEITHRFPDYFEDE